MLYSRCIPPGPARFGVMVIGSLLLAAAPGFPVHAADDNHGDEPPVTPAIERSSTEVPATTPAESVDPPMEPVSERVRVIATPVEKVPGSVSYLNKETLAEQGYTDIHRVLSRVPGVNFQEEEGYGLRPNIGMRGTGVERSQKITLLEDGVLIAPAPYSAPAAYYFPTVARMEGIEVRKGSSSIRQGPFTNGGVLNLISSSIPSEFGGNLDLAAGDDDLRRGSLRLGDSGARFGWIAETFRMRTDGFKQLDGGGPTGFDLDDSMVKLRLNSRADARRFQALELKLGRTDQFGHETYVGLTENDFEANPFRRYAGSQQDRLDTTHEQAHLRYMVRLSDATDVTATLYRNDFFRNWSKLESVSGVGISTLFDDPSSYAAELDILRGDVDSAADQLAVRNNRREYYSQGIEAVIGFNPDGVHSLEFGVRYHEDEEDQFQEEDRFAIAGGEMSLTSSGAPGSQANRIARAEAIALFAQDTITLDRLTLTPGLRFESIDLERLDFGTADPQRSGVALATRRNSVDVVIPGIGAAYQLTELSGVFVGVHRGFAPPAPGSTEEVDAEESVNFEAGYRFVDSLLAAQVVGFFNDYENLLGSDTLSSGGTGSGDQFNGGAVHVRGIEAAVSYDFGRARGGRIGIPVNLTYTYTDSEFQASFESEFEEWGEVDAGDELPYLPQHQGALSFGVVLPRWSAYTNLTWVDTMRTVAGQGPLAPDSGTDSHFTADLTASFNARRDLRLYGQVRNLTDEIYVVARRPAGARPGIGRTVLAGVAWNF